MSIRYLLIVFTLITLFQNLRGQDTYISNGNGDWDDTSTWLVNGLEPATVPGSDDDVTISSGDEVRIQSNPTAVDNLTIIGTLEFDKDETLNVGGNVTVSGTSALITGDKGNTTISILGNLNIPSSSSLGITKQSITVSGTTTVDGTLAFNDDDGTYSFGEVDINSSGTWNNTDKGDFSFSGNLTNDGSFTGCSDNNCKYTFTGTGVTIGGANTMNLPDLTISGSATLSAPLTVKDVTVSGTATISTTLDIEDLDIDGTVTNTGSITLNNAFSGSGSFTNDNGSSLELTGATEIAITTVDFSTPTNTLTLSNDQNVELPDAAYSNIVVNLAADNDKVDFLGGASSTVQSITLNNGKVEVEGDLTVTGDVTLNAGADEFKIKDAQFDVANVTVSDGKFKVDNDNSDVNISGNLTSNGTGSELDIKKGNTDIGGNLDIDDGTLDVGVGGGGNANLTVEGTTDLDTDDAVTVAVGTFTTTNLEVSSSTTVTVETGATSTVEEDLVVEGNYEVQGTPAPVSFVDLTVSSALSLTSETTVTGILTLSSGNLTLDTHNLILSPTATVSGGSSSSYININSTGRLRQQFSTTPKTTSFPIGDADTYSPITSFTLNSASLGATDPYIEPTFTETPHPNRDTDNTGAGGDDDGTTATSYLNRFWTITGNDITSPNYSVSYEYLTTGDVGGTTASESAMLGTVYAQHQGAGFNDWLVAGAVNPTTNIVSVSDIDAFGDLYAMDNTSERLPIVLISFDAKVFDNKVILLWSTATEINNDFFTVQRSDDGLNWSDILTVPGAGNSSDILNYQVEDVAPLFGRSYYRLKQTDYDGTFDYSDVSSVFLEKCKLSLTIYPNPIYKGKEVHIKLSDSDVVGSYFRLIDTHGHVVKSGVLNQNNLSIDTSYLDRGLYEFILKTREGYLVKKFLIH